MENDTNTNTLKLWIQIQIQDSRSPVSNLLLLETQQIHDDDLMLQYIDYEGGWLLLCNTETQKTVNFLNQFVLLFPQSVLIRGHKGVFRLILTVLREFYVFLCVFCASFSEAKGSFVPIYTLFASLV